MLDLLLQLICLGLIVVAAALIFIIVTAKKGAPDIMRFESEKYFSDENGAKKPFPSLFDQPTVKLSVIVPAYNEEERLPVMMEETLEFLEAKLDKNSTDTYEIIIVDDGSKDTTSKVALGYTGKLASDKCRVLTLAKNRGKGGAVRLGMFSARGEYLLMVDADGATQFSDLDKVAASLKTLAADATVPGIAVGSRAHLEEDSIANRSLFRTILMKGFHFIVWILCVRSVHDSQCGFKLLTRSAAQKTFPNLHVERWAFDVELLFIAEKFNIPIAEVAVKWEEIEGSKIVPVLSWLQMGRDILLIWLHYFLGLWTISVKTE